MHERRYAHAHRSHADIAPPLSIVCTRCARFRALSLQLVLLIHPDKNPARGAKDCFEAVKSAHLTLVSSSGRYDYLRLYAAFLRSVDMRRVDYLPPSLTNTSLELTLQQGRALALQREAQREEVAARMQRQAEGTLDRARAGEALKYKKEAVARQEDIKRKITQADAGGERSDESDDSDADGMTVAEKIRAAKQKQRKKVKML
jgi:curved DNA-binding protein CbpA